jgi:hypothetical protein
METGLSSNGTPDVPLLRFRLTALAALLAPVATAALAAQDDSTATPPPAENAPADPAAAAASAQPAGAAPRMSVLVTVPRGEEDAADLRECRKDEEASAISGEIVVCRVRGNDAAGLTGSRSESQKRYAQETAFKGAPPPPDLFGIPDNGKGIGFGKPPPVAITVDFAALPKAPTGSDADRIAQGLPPLGQNEELSEEQERARREAAGIKTTVPPRPKKRKAG